MNYSWNPWHGCSKISPGCQNCYVYREDNRYDRDSTQVTRNRQFDLPLQRRRDGGYLLPPGSEVFTCGTSDFFLAQADGWRAEAWRMIRARPDLRFTIITKRIDRFYCELPDDWENGYDNVSIGCTVENQDRADYRLPLFLRCEIRHRLIIAAPLLEELHLSSYLRPERIEELSVGGESGPEARVCDFAWILSLRQQCMEAGVPFRFHQTGARLRMGGRDYRIPRPYQHSQARQAAIDWQPDE